MFKVKTHSEIQAFMCSHNSWEERRLCPIFVCYTLAFTIQLKKKMQKNLTQGIQKVPVARNSVC